MIIIFNGPPGSGKDHACEVLSKEFGLGFIHLSFKYELFKAVINYYNVDKNWFMEGYNDRKRKDEPEPLLNFLSRRQAMIHVSEDIIKPQYGNDYFGKMSSKAIKQGHHYCFSDGGFPVESIPLINTGEEVILFQLMRDGCDFSQDSRKYMVNLKGCKKEITIGSQTVLGPDNFDFSKPLDIDLYRIHNNGTASEFTKALAQLVEQLLNDSKRQAAT